MSAPLFTNEPDPVRRLRKTHDALAAMKERHRALPAELLQDTNHFIPGGLRACGSAPSRSPPAAVAARPGTWSSPTFPPAVPALLRRCPAGRELPRLGDHRRHGAQHHRDELLRERWTSGSSPTATRCRTSGRCSIDCAAHSRSSSSARTHRATSLSGRTAFERRMRAGIADADGAGRCRLDAMARWLQDIAYADLVDAGFEGRGAWIVRRTRIRVSRSLASGGPRAAHLLQRHRPLLGRTPHLDQRRARRRRDGRPLGLPGPGARQADALSPDFISVYEEAQAAATQMCGSATQIRLRAPSAQRGSSGSRRWTRPVTSTTRTTGHRSRRTWRADPSPRRSTPRSSIGTPRSPRRRFCCGTVPRAGSQAPDGAIHASIVRA